MLLFNVIAIVYVRGIIIMTRFVTFVKYFWNFFHVWFVLGGVFVCFLVGCSLFGGGLAASVLLTLSRLFCMYMQSTKNSVMYLRRKSCNNFWQKTFNSVS